MAAGAAMTVAVAGVVQTAPATQTGVFYNFSLADQAGTVAANNFVSMFNPANSGKTITIQFAAVDSYNSGASNTLISMAGFRTTAASGGTLVAASTISRFLITSADPVAVIRTGNPTVTVDAVLSQPIIHFPPPVNGGSSSGQTGQTAIPTGATFQIPPGHGIVFSTSAGNTAQEWGFRIIWTEQ